MIITKGEINSMNTVNIGAQIQFKYIRYIGPKGQYCKINNIRIFGFQNEGLTQLIEYYKPSNLPLMVIHTSTGRNLQVKKCQLLSLQQMKMKSQSAVVQLI